MKLFRFELRPAPPFRLDLTAWVLRRRDRNVVDRWDGTTYRRVLVIHQSRLQVAVTQTSPCEQPKLEVTISGPLAPGTRVAVTELLTRMLGLRTNLQPFYELAVDRRLARLVEQFRGVKPPRFPSVFEALVNAVACQQLSLTVGIELLNRLAMRGAAHTSSGKAKQYAFPSAEDLLRLKAPTFRSLGFSYSKAGTLLGFSRQTVAADFDPERLEALDNECAVERLMNLRGVGRWTAEYVLLRGLGRINIFPGDDVGARNRLASWLHRDGPLDYDGVKRAVRRWQPYAGMVYFHLLLAGLTASGEMLQHEAQPPRKA